MLIHASKRWYPTPLGEIEKQFGLKFDPKKLLRCGFVGRVDLVDVVTTHLSPYFTGPYGFVLDHAHQTNFVPYAGKQQLFEVDPDVARLVRRID